jgi:hypothetical protein
MVDRLVTPKSGRDVRSNRRLLQQRQQRRRVLHSEPLRRYREPRHGAG